MEDKKTKDTKQNMKIGLFTYDFNHRKSKDFALVLTCLGYKIECMLSAPKIKLTTPKPIIRTNIKSHEYFHPKDIAELLSIPYYVVVHNSEKCIQIIKKYNLDIGIIAGARILNQNIIDSFNKGVINFHPGLLPYNRGLDNLKWAVALNMVQGVTTHFINHRIDAGWIIEKETLPVSEDDTYFDIDNRLYEKQLEMIQTTMEKIKNKNKTDFEYITDGIWRSTIPIEVEQEIESPFDIYKKKYMEWENHLR